MNYFNRSKIEWGNYSHSSYWGKHKAKYYYIILLSQNCIDDQGFSEATQEEEKLPETIQTENQTTQPDETTNVQTEGSQINLTTEPGSLLWLCFSNLLI